MILQFRLRRGVQGKLVEYLKQNMQINVISLNEEEVVFDLIGVDASIANALRRILIAEVNFCCTSTS